MRHRLAARDFKPKGEKDRADLFAAMPALEAKRLLFKKAASHKGKCGDGRLVKQKLLFMDVKKAYLNGKVQEDDKAYIELPEGYGQSGTCGQIATAVARNEAGGRRLGSRLLREVVRLRHAQSDLGADSRCVVHGDDVTFMGRPEDWQ